MAEFTVQFNVEKDRPTEDWADYRDFIEGLRRDLADTYSHNLPVLPTQENPPTRWFDIVLQTNSYEITLRIRRDNLYLDAYQMPDGQWYEFGSSTSPHLIPESSFLGFDGGYNDLQRVSGRRMDDIPLGQQQLTNAVNELATSVNSETRARSLIVVIQMVSESIRYSEISNHLATTFLDGSPPPDWMLALEHGWGDLSAALLRLDADPTNPFLPQPNDMNIVSALDAVAVLGILLRPSSLRLVQLMADANDGLEGRPFVVVFSVLVNDIDEEDPGDLYGNISVSDGLGSQYIYNRSSDDSESISPGKTVLLTGPARSISAYGSFTINVDLKDKDKLSPDDEVSKGQISWNVFNTTNTYDEPLNEVVYGEYGLVTVNYIVLSDAVEATVEVTLINGDGENPADVYGLLTARMGDFTNEIVLFRKTDDEPISVEPGQLIPLSRSVVAVPSNSSLIIGADLLDYDTVSSNDEIAKGTAEFPAQLPGTSEKVISGEDGEIMVKVTWMDM